MYIFILEYNFCNFGKPTNTEIMGDWKEKEQKKFF